MCYLCVFAGAFSDGSYSFRFPLLAYTQRHTHRHKTIHGCTFFSYNCVSGVCARCSFCNTQLATAFDCVVFRLEQACIEPRGKTHSNVRQQFHNSSLFAQGPIYYQAQSSVQIYFATQRCAFALRRCRLLVTACIFYLYVLILSSPQSATFSLARLFVSADITQRFLIYYTCLHKPACRNLMISSDPILLQYSKRQI